MSVCVYFRSNKSLEPKTIFKELANRAKRIVVTSAEYPCLNQMRRRHNVRVYHRSVSGSSDYPFSVFSL